MQWLFNLIYQALDTFFGLIGKIQPPSYISDLILSITKYCVIVNFYFPLDVLIQVVLSVISVSIILMLISAFLQTF